MPKLTESPKKGQQTEMLYPTLQVNGVDIPLERLWIDAEKAKVLLDWQTEPEYTAEMLEKNPKMNPKEAMFGDKVHVALTDLEGHKVTLWNNAGNRCFDAVWGAKIRQDILTGNWRFNCETIQVSKTGKVISGQHRLIELILAEQERTIGKNAAHWMAIWPEPIRIQSLLVTGANEDAETLRTVDQTKPRRPEDVVFTSPIFAKYDLASRKVCSQMLGAAVELLWRRTNANSGQYEKLLTNAALMEFIDRHPKIIEAVDHIFTENSDRDISGLKLGTPGQCAGLMYLMAASKTDDNYRNNYPRTEELVDLSEWGTAHNFWVCLAGKKPAVRDALHSAATNLLNFSGQDAAEDGSRGAQPDANLKAKHALLCLAWKAYAAKGKVEDEDVDLTPYIRKNANGFWVFAELPDFGGIDCGDKKDEADEEVEEAEVEEAAAAPKQDVAKAAKASQAKAKADKDAEVARALAEKEERRKREAAMKGDPTKRKLGAKPVTQKINPAGMTEAEKKALAVEQAEKLKAANAKKKAPAAK